jgi:hypothetical protein
MFKEKAMRGLICLLAIVLVSLGWAVGKKTADSEQSAEVKARVEKTGTPTFTEVEALGPTKAVSSIMQGLGRVGEKHKVLFIEVLEENYDTFLPGLMVRRDWEEPYFEFDKKKKKITIPQYYSPNMLNIQREIRKNVYLVVKHTLEYKGIGRRYPKYYIYEVSQVPTIINLTDVEVMDYEEKFRFVDNLKVINIFPEGEVEFIYEKERIRLKPEGSWKSKKRSKVIPIESDKYFKEKFDDLRETVKSELELRRRVSDELLEAIKATNVTFLTEVIIFNHGIVEIETYNRRSR